jgi:hypothetical protein
MSTTVTTRRTLIDGTLSAGHEVVFLQANRDLDEAGHDLTGGYAWEGGLPSSSLRTVRQLLTRLILAHRSRAVRVSNGLPEAVHLRPPAGRKAWPHRLQVRVWVIQ